MPMEDMANPGVLLRSFSQKITTVNATKTTIQRKSSDLGFSKEKHIENPHIVIEIEGNKKPVKIEINKGICPICYEDSGNMRKLACGHEFCQVCLMDYLRNKINIAQIIVFKCPSEKCQYELKDDVLMGFLDLENGLKEKYLKFKLKLEISQDKTRLFCIKPGCEAIITKDLLLDYGKCGTCGMELCFLCGNVWHPKEKNCLLVMDSVFQDYLQTVDFKNCPKCHQVIEKGVGCNVMACPSCRFTFCWLCLREYKIGHFSVFNLNGCAGLDSASYGKNASSCRKSCEKFKGICGFLLKMLYFFVIGVVIYPFLPIICVIILLAEHKKNGGVVRCDRAHWKKVCCLVTLGILLGLFAYVTYPIGFLAIFCYMCICNPHVAYPYQNRGNNRPRDAGNEVLPPGNIGDINEHVLPPGNITDN